LIIQKLETLRLYSVVVIDSSSSQNIAWSLPTGLPSWASACRLFCGLFSVGSRQPIQCPMWLHRPEDTDTEAAFTDRGGL